MAADTRAPNFAFDFFESCGAHSGTTITGNHAAERHCGDRRSGAVLTSESGFVEGPPGGFTISAEYVVQVAAPLPAHECTLGLWLVAHPD